MKPQNPEHKAPEGLTDKWLPREGWRRAGRLPGPRDKPPPLFLAQCLLPHFSGQPMDTTQVEQLLGKLMPTLGHLDQELLATRPFLASGQVSLADLMAFTELMQVRSSCPLAIWRVLRAWAEPRPQLPYIPSTLPSVATSSKTSPGLPRGGPVWRLPWAPSLSRRPTGLCFSAQEAQHDPPDGPEAGAAGEETAPLRAGPPLRFAGRSKRAVCPSVVSSLALL